MKIDVRNLDYYSDEDEEIHFNNKRAKTQKKTKIKDGFGRTDNRKTNKVVRHDKWNMIEDE